MIAATKVAQKVKLDSYSDDEIEVVEELGVEDVVKREVGGYFAEANPESLPTITWWRTNALRDPNLSRVARRNLAVRATSAESERDFSAAGFV